MPLDVKDTVEICRSFLAPHHYQLIVAMFRRLDTNGNQHLDPEDFTHPDPGWKQYLQDLWKNIKKMHDLNRDGIVTEVEFTDGFLRQAYDNKVKLVSSAKLGGQLAEWVSSFSTVMDRILIDFHAQIPANHNSELLDVEIYSPRTKTDLHRLVKESRTFLRQDQIQKMQDMFYRLDANQNGRLERSDFKNYDAHDKLWQDILEVHDFDGDGAVTELEFIDGFLHQAYNTSRRIIYTNQKLGPGLSELVDVYRSVIDRVLSDFDRRLPTLEVVDDEGDLQEYVRYYKLAFLSVAVAVCSVAFVCLASSDLTYVVTVRGWVTQLWDRTAAAAGRGAMSLLIALSDVCLHLLKNASVQLGNLKHLWTSSSLIAIFALLMLVFFIFIVVTQ